MNFPKTLFKLVMGFYRYWRVRWALQKEIAESARRRQKELEDAAARPLQAHPTWKETPPPPKTRRED